MATQRDNSSDGPRRGHLRSFWDWTAIGEKSLFDFAQLLVVPFAVAGIGLWFQMTINDSSRASDTDRAQERALQAYLDGMTSLIIDGRLGLERELPGVGVVAKARTAAVLSTLDRDRNQVVLRFLRDGNLVVEAGVEDRTSRVSLIDADLTSADLRGLDLRGINLHGAKLNGADLEGADLRNTTLSNVEFKNANLRKADLGGADLCGAFLVKADLQGAVLKDALLFNATLREADLRNADLTGADMRDAALSVDEHGNPELMEDLDRKATTVKDYAKLGLIRPEAAEGCFETSFVVYPYATILQDANLRGADITGAKITEQQLEHAKVGP